jgi:hypothetical protein
LVSWHSMTYNKDNMTEMVIFLANLVNHGGAE